jgi:ubiquinone/menaquinone biosynthesis C-methylase UbiE
MERAFFYQSRKLSMTSNAQQINELYTDDYCRQLELAYGEHMMSEGGASEIDRMFENIELCGKRILDFGCGIGGIAIHLASKYKASVCGVDVSKSAITIAKNLIPTNLRNTVSFTFINGDGNLPFTDSSFDVICSKGVITHLPQQLRGRTFNEFYRLLKIGGKLTIMDWISPTQGKWGTYLKELSKTEGLPIFAHTPYNYQNDLTKSGFRNTTFQDCAGQYARYNKKIAERLETPSIKQKFIAEFGDQIYTDHLTGYQNIYKAHASGEVMSAAIRAVK